MNPKITEHAKTRFCQRGINEQILDYIMKYGDTEYAPGGAYRISLKKRNKDKLIKTFKKAIHKIERAKDLIIVEKDENILTGYRRL